MQAMLYRRQNWLKIPMYSNKEISSGRLSRMHMDELNQEMQPPVRRMSRCIVSNALWRSRKMSV